MGLDPEEVTWTFVHAKSATGKLIASNPSGDARPEIQPQISIAKRMGNRQFLFTVGA